MKLICIFNDLKCDDISAILAEIYLAYAYPRQSGPVYLYTLHTYIQYEL